jgi:hypothetical protein
MLHFYNHPDYNSSSVVTIELSDQATSYHFQTFLTGDIQTQENCNSWLNQIYDAKHNTEYSYSSFGNCCTTTVTHDYLTIENEYLELDDISKPISLENAYIILSKWKDYLETRSNIEYSWSNEKVNEIIHWNRIPERKTPKGSIKCTISEFKSTKHSGYVVIPDSDIQSLKEKIDQSIFLSHPDLIQIVFQSPNYFYIDSIENLSDELKIDKQFIDFFKYDTSQIVTYIDQEDYEKTLNESPLLEEGRFCVYSDGNYYYSAVEPKTNERRETLTLPNRI